MKWTLEAWIGQISEAIAAEVTTVEGHNVTVKPGSGPRVFVTIEGAEGDPLVIRAAKTLIAPILKKEVETESKRLGYKITSSNRGEDLVITAEVVFP